MRRQAVTRLLGAVCEACSCSLSASATTSQASTSGSRSLLQHASKQISHGAQGSHPVFFRGFACGPSSASLAPQSTMPAVTKINRSARALVQAARSPKSPKSTAPASHQAAPSPFPPTVPGGPLTVQYPVQPEYYQDREAIVFSMGGEPQGVHALPGSIYNVPVRIDILQRVVRWLRAMWQQGTHKAKNRAEVSGGGRKPWPQKGTGRARTGSIRSPLWKGGGVVHGPRPRSHAHRLPLSIQLLGYKCALSARANEGRLILVDSLVPPADPASGRIKTKHTQQLLGRLLQGVPHSTVLLVDSGEVATDGGAALRQGAGNLPHASIMPWQQVTVYHLLKHGAVVLTRPAAAALAAKLSEPLPQHAARPRRMAWWSAQGAAYQSALQELMAAQKQ